MDIQPSLISYKNSQQYLKDVFEYKKEKNSQYTISAWSKKMGFSHPSSLEYLLNGRRKVRPSHLQNLLRGLDFCLNDKVYFEELVYMENSKSQKEQDFYEDRLNRISSYQEVDDIDTSTMNQISRWYYFSIMSMTALRGFKRDAKWISKRLKHRIDSRTVSDSIARLIKMGFLVEGINKSIKPASKRAFSFSTKWSSKAIVDIQREVISLAQRSVGVDAETLFYTSSMTIDKSKLKEAQNMTQEYMSRMASLLETEEGDETYQLNIQFFGVTKEL